jgi:hypothetical protein
MTVARDKCPWPWFGGKRHAAPHVWAALGDPNHYVEPFCGSLAVLLQRPALANRTYHSETVNDMDGLLVNAWRAIQLHPEETAEAASWPVSEADLHARHLWLLRWRAERDLERLMGDPDWCDPRAAGYWMWGQSCWIGSGWCSGKGPWILGEGGRLVRRPGHAGEGQKAKRPHITDDGVGVNHAGLRECGCGTEPDWHPMVMPELRAWFRFLSARLRHVRILNGDWTRACTGGATLTLSCRQGLGPCGVFLDPPYSTAAGRSDGLYACEDLDVAGAVRDWCLERGDDDRYRIVLAGFEGEGHEVLVEHGWREVEWFTGKMFLAGGMGNQRGRRGEGKDVAQWGEDEPDEDNGNGGGRVGNQQKRERLWLSPHCLRPVEPAQGSLSFEEEAP